MEEALSTLEKNGLVGCCCCCCCESWRGGMPPPVVGTGSMWTGGGGLRRRCGEAASAFGAGAEGGIPRCLLCASVGCVMGGPCAFVGQKIVRSTIKVPTAARDSEAMLAIGNQETPPRSSTAGVRVADATNAENVKPAVTGDTLKEDRLAAQRSKAAGATKFPNVVRGRNLAAIESVSSVMGTTGKLVPWRGWSEWEEARRLLVDSESHDEWRLGCALVAVWRARPNGSRSLPAAVDASASLRDAQMRDPGLHSVSPLEEAPLRLLYSAAIVRLVNGVVDTVILYYFFIPYLSALHYKYFLLPGPAGQVRSLSGLLGRTHGLSPPPG
jgi:hypothetical protein